MSRQTAIKKSSGDYHKTVSFTYTNYRGEKAVRKVYPTGLRFGSSKWHPREQWLLQAYDLEKKDHREFALVDIEGIENSY